MDLKKTTEQPKKKVLLTSKRLNEIADSLENDAKSKIKLAESQKKYIGKSVDSLMKTEWGKTVKMANSAYYTDENGKLLDPKTYGTTADEKIQSGKKQLENANRYKRLSEAVKKVNPKMK